MFGSKRKQREAAESAARQEAFSAWFDRLAQARAEGMDMLTDELVTRVGNPYAFMGPGAARDSIPFLTARYFGQEWAARLSRKAILDDDPDAKSRAKFWDSVSSWL
jgi:hypothetical protein